MSLDDALDQVCRENGQAVSMTAGPLHGLPESVRSFASQFIDMPRWLRLAAAKFIRLNRDRLLVLVGEGVDAVIAWLEV